MDGGGSNEVEPLVLFSKCSHPPRHLITIKTGVRIESKIMI